METLIEFTNEETQMRSYVVANTISGFNVVLQDLDSGGCIPAIVRLPTLAAAEAYAAKLVAA